MRWAIGGLVLIVLCANFACTFFKDRPAKDFAGATGGEGLEQVFWKNVKAKDWKAIDQILASNFVGTSASGSSNTAAWMEGIRQLELQDYSIGNLSVQLNANTVVVTYDMTMIGTRSGQPLPSTPGHWMSVWQQQKSGWILIAQAVGGSQVR